MKKDESLNRRCSDYLDVVAKKSSAFLKKLFSFCII